ncbi:hypothetical protein Nepgr_008631 [Nepenthes gracilis]|uniref:Uncharacterized protein n=1 Tax=Nepenthes gracilis TaxID=150966 RepID=A0AAD3S9E1_NEPGR|nr:hypothetical protein Nepgr_008631 [Nepenthes gracilis]
MEEVVMEAVLSGGREERIQAAAMALGKLTSKQKHKLVEKGIIIPLVSMLNNGDNEAVEAALLAFLSLAYGSERNKIRIAKSGAIPALLTIIQCNQTAIMELAITTLFVLSSCTGSRQIIASSGAIPLLVGLLAEDYEQSSSSSSNNNNNDVSFGISTQAKLDAICTLHNLTTCNQIIPSLISSGVAFYLLREVIDSPEKSSDIVEKSMALLENIVSSSETGLKRVAAAEGAIQAFVETIEEGSPQCKEHAVGILLLICQSCRDKYRGILLKEGVMPGLLQLSVDGTRRARNLAQTLLLLLRERSSNNGSKSKQSKSEIMEQIMERIDAEEDGLNGTTLRLVEQMIAKLSA